jgi:long-chain fatty acid transport protein
MIKTKSFRKTVSMWSRNYSVCKLASVFLLFSFGSTSAFASLFISPHGSGRDAELAGNTVASPEDGSSALQFNPAGVAGPARDQAMMGLVWFGLVSKYQNSQSGYDGSGNKTAVNLSAWYGLGEIGGWSVGLGAYGAVGTAFDLPSDPDIGIDSPFIGELGLLNFGVNVGRELVPGLRVGAQITPIYGQQRVVSPSPLGRIDVQAEGFGLSGMVGVVYQPNKVWALGLSYRSPGFIDMKGDGSVGSVEQDIDIDFVAPQMLMGGISYRWSEKLHLLGQLSWMRHKDFERGEVTFDETPLLNQPVMGETRNRVRWGVGMEYQIVSNSVARIGYTHSKAAMKDSALMPMMFDNENGMLMMGYEIDYGRALVGFNVGFTSVKSRRVDEEDNMEFPGKYDVDADMSAGLHLTWNLKR